MCAGMITMTGIKRIIFGQRDIIYNYSFERINRNIEVDGENNFYPVKAEACIYADEYVKQLDDLYKEFLMRDSEKIRAKFLASEEARIIFEKANNEFLNFKARTGPEETTYKLAIDFYEKEKGRLSRP